MIQIQDDVIESSNCKKKVKRKSTFQNECVNAVDTVSDSAFDKSTDDRSHHGNLFDHSTITDVNTHMSDFDKTRYDYNLTIIKSPKPATDTIYPHIKF